MAAIMALCLAAGKLQLIRTRTNARRFIGLPPEPILVYSRTLLKSTTEF
jgi:hypothetical protein